MWQHLRYLAPRFGRFKHLVALPLVGTGKGGASEYEMVLFLIISCIDNISFFFFRSIGGIVVELLPELYRAASKYGFDIALVTIKRPTFAAIELTRRSARADFLLRISTTTH